MSEGGVPEVSVPLRGVGCFGELKMFGHRQEVSVPLRGVGCFRKHRKIYLHTTSFRPLAGCGLFLFLDRLEYALIVSVPLRGVGCFADHLWHTGEEEFPSPCGVWVVSAMRL